MISQLASDPVNKHKAHNEHVLMGILILMMFVVGGSSWKFIGDLSLLMPYLIAVSIYFFVLLRRELRRERMRAVRMIEYLCNTKGFKRKKNISRPEPLYEKFIIQKVSVATPRELRNVPAGARGHTEYFAQGEMFNMSVEIYTQEAMLDLGRGLQRKKYIVLASAFHREHPQEEFLIVPKNAQQAIHKQIAHHISETIYPDVAYEKFHTESREFSNKYDIWTQVHREGDTAYILRILTPEFMEKLLRYEHAIYIEVSEHEIRIYDDTYDLGENDIVEHIELLAHMKQNCSRS